MKRTGTIEINDGMLGILLLLFFTLGVIAGGGFAVFGEPKHDVVEKLVPTDKPILPPPAPAVVMRDARIICLSAILAKTPKSNWDQITREEAHSGNVCEVAQFLYPHDIPEDIQGPARGEAIEAIDHGK